MTESEQSLAGDLSGDTSLESSDDSLRQRLAQHEKADLHVHFEGIIDPAMYLELCALSRHDPLEAFAIGERSFCCPEVYLNESIVSKYPDSEFPDSKYPVTEATGIQFSFAEFINIFLAQTRTLCSPEAILLAGESYLKSCQGQGIVATEFLITSGTFHLLGIDFCRLLPAFKELERIARVHYSHHLVWILDIARNSPLPLAETAALLPRILGAPADARINLKALSLSGWEGRGALDEFVTLPDLARKYGLKVVAHAGEGTSATAVSDTITHLAPYRIGHGLSAAESESCITMLNARPIPLEISPWSNTLLGICSPDKHPLPALLNHDVTVCLCSDDPGIFRKDLLDNYILAHQIGVTEEQLIAIARNSLRWRFN